VEEAVVGGKQFGYRPVVQEYLTGEQLHFLLQQRTDTEVDATEQVRVGLHFVHLGQVQPLVGKVRGQGGRARITQHAFNLATQHLGLTKGAGFSESEQFVVGNGAPQEEGQAA